MYKENWSDLPMLSAKAAHPKPLPLFLKKNTNDDVLSCLQMDSSVTKIVLHRFHPSPLLKLHISNILLGRDTSWLADLNKSNSGQIVPEQCITFNFAVKNLEVDPWLTQLTTSKQMDIAIIYLHELTSGYTLIGMQIRLSTLKEYINTMAKWVETHVGHDIRYHPTVAFPDAPMTHWEHYPIFRNIYADTKAWQGIPSRQDPVTKSMINYL